MNAVILGVLGTKLLAATLGGPALFLLGLGLLTLAMEALRRRAGEKAPIAQRIELPQAIADSGGRAQTRCYAHHAIKGSPHLRSIAFVKRYRFPPQGVRLGFFV